MSDQPNASDYRGVFSRLLSLGTMTDQVFRRVYSGLGRKAENEQRVARSRHQQRILKKRDIDIERLTGILAALDDGIIMQDTEGRIVVVNQAARDLLGSQRAFWQSELGTMFNAYRHVEQLDSEVAVLGEPVRVQINNRILGAQIAAVADSDGNRIGTMIVLRDMTHDALADRLKDHFITAISHELRTPMAVIKGMSEVLLGQPADARPNRRLLETLSRNVDILDRMIVELLDISELSEGKFGVRDDVLDLEALLWNVVNGLTAEVRRAGLDVTVMVRDLNQLMVTGDDPRLRWALGHLLQNSIRYTEQGGHIIITARRNGEDQVAVQVVDTGVGISEKDLPRIFERFYRGEARTLGGRLIDPRGLGQGLFIARRVTEAHGGYLTVSSQPGAGSVFTMVLPARSA